MEDSAEEIIPGILRDSFVGDVVSGQTLQSAKSNERISVVAKILSDNHISSIPVFSAEEEDGGAFLGLVDFSDVVAYLLRAEWESALPVEGQDVWAQFGDSPVGKAIDLGKRNPAVRVGIDATLVEAVSLISEQNLRRLVVENEDKEVVAVLSPSEIMKYVVKNLNARLDSTLVLPIGELEVYDKKSKVLSVKKKENMLTAMHRMLKQRKSAIAVVDDHSGALAASLSMTDIKVLFREKKFSRLTEPVWKYITDMRESSDFEVFPFFGVSENAKLQVVISKLLVTSVHHMYVVNKSNIPKGVISFSGVCRGLLANIDH